MIEAFVLIQAEVALSGSAARALGEIKGVRWTDVVTGPYDMIARVEAANMDALGTLIVAKVQTVAGVARTLTCPIVRL